MAQNIVDEIFLDINHTGQNCVWKKTCGLKIVGQMVFGQNDIGRNVIGRNVFGRIVLHPTCAVVKIPLGQGKNVWLYSIDRP